MPELLAKQKVRPGKEAIATLNRAQAADKPHVQTLFSDVLDELPWNLSEQQSELVQHLENYAQHYTVSEKQLGGLKPR